PSPGILAMKCAFALMLIAALQAALPAHAPPYPSSPIRLIVPFAAGGTYDILARQIAPKLNEAWGQPVIVENKTGANGNVGSDIGGAPQLAGIEFAQRTGIQWTYIPYQGGSDAVTAVAAGQADVLFNGMLATWPSVQGGRLSALAISSAQLVAAAPDTPTVAEQGLAGFETGSFQGVVGPAGMPRASVTKLNSELI